MTSLTVSEEALLAGKLAFIATPKGTPSEIWLTDVYLAMLSKDHSIAVDDVERIKRVEAEYWASFRENRAPVISPFGLRCVLDKAITAIGSQSIGGGRGLVGDRTFCWIYSGSCLFAAASFALMVGGVWSFIVGILMFFCGGFFERGRVA